MLFPVGDAALPPTYDAAATLLDPSSQVLDEGTEDEISVQGYSVVGWRLALYWVLVLALGGLPALFFYWVPRYKVVLTSKKAPLAKADTVLITVKL